MSQSLVTALFEPLASNWRCARTPAGMAASPDDLPDVTWLPAQVPGTFAGALRSAGLWDGVSPLPLDQDDIWYCASFPGGGDDVLRFEGLATIAEAWLNGERVLVSDNMFLPQQLAANTQENNELHICFRSLTSWLAGQRGRARWRTRLAAGSLRFARTTLLGRMPGWCPTIHPVGPWRPVLRRRRDASIGITTASLRVSLQGGIGVVDLLAGLPDGTSESARNESRPSEIVLDVAGRSVALRPHGPSAISARIEIPQPALWWPHTHGDPALHPANLRFGGQAFALGQVGFRDIAAQHGADGDGFALTVNRTPVFCRGACWTSPDIVTLPGDTAAYRPTLSAMRDAGMNIVRVGGTMLYEADAFYALCDELGLLVWQDAMLANFDYPTTGLFRSSLCAELAAFLQRTAANPSLAVFCGGSEVLQQAAMFGTPHASVDASLYSTIIPDMVRQHRPDIPYVPNSPSGGALPFQPNSGVSHYYGVGAYLRPLEDARRANVRFASECLALANVPGATSPALPKVSTSTDPEWKRGVPHDPGAGWDFDDVRDHYLRALFGLDPTQLRWADYPRYLNLSRAVSCLLIDAVFAEWRRVGSTCAGGLVWHLRDLANGAGWGVIDAAGRKKPAWYALRRAFRSRQVILTDEGLNGLHIHVLNEIDRPLTGQLRLTVLRQGGQIVRSASCAITLPARHARCYRSAELLPIFFDITDAYRFGPPSHDVTVASLLDDMEETVFAEAVHFPRGPSLPVQDPGLKVELQRAGDAWQLKLSAHAFVQFLHIDDPDFEPDDDWIHLPPGQERTVRLQPLRDPDATPSGEIGALNMDRVVSYGTRA